MSLTRRTPRHLAATAMLTGLALLGACSSGDDNAKPSAKVPSGNTSTSPTKISPAPTATPSTKTPTPRPTEQGALDTAVAAVRAIDHEFATWDANPIRRLAAKSCNDCRDFTTVMPDRKRQGYSMSGGRVSITGAAQAVAGSLETKQFLVKIPISVTELITHDPEGSIYRNSHDIVGSDTAIPAARARLDVDWNGQKWEITSFGILI